MNLSIYYAEICKEPILTRTEEEDLFKKFQAKETTEKEKEVIRSRIIRANLRFAFKQAKNYSKNDPGVFEDLISAGNEGLIVGFEKFNPNAKVRFLSYAGWWVVQRILKEMSKMRVVSLPIWKQQLAARIMKAKENNEDVSLDDLKEEFSSASISHKDIEELYQTRYLTYYIDDMNEEDFEIDPIGEEVQKNIDNTRMWKAVASLPSPHREVIARTYGLEDGKEQSIAKISKALRVPKEELDKIKKEGIEMLKKVMVN